MDIETGALLGGVVQRCVGERTATTWTYAERWEDADSVYVYIDCPNTGELPDLDRGLYHACVDVTETLVVDAAETNMQTDADRVVRVRVTPTDGFDPDELSPGHS